MSNDITFGNYCFLGEETDLGRYLSRSTIVTTKVETPFGHKVNYDQTNS